MKTLRANRNISGTLVAIVLMLLCWSGFFLLCNENPANALVTLVNGAFRTPDKCYSVVNKLFLFFFTALAYCIPAWTGMFNVGADGQLMLGGFFAAIIPLIIVTPFRLINVLIALLVAVLAGGLWALWPAVLKVKFGVNEIVTTLLGNYVVIYVTEYFINFPLRSAGASIPRTDYIPDSFHFPTITGTLSASFLLVIAAFIGVEFFRRRTVSGYEYELIGNNAFMAKQVGVSTDKLQIQSMLVGGMFSGLAGGLLVLTLNFCYMTGFSNDFGMSGMLVALIASCSPAISLVITGIFSVLQVGAINMQMMTSIPSEITGVLQSVMVFFIVSRSFLSFRKGNKMK